jgi:hypothetical protein
MIMSATRYDMKIKLRGDFDPALGLDTSTVVDVSVDDMDELL